MQKVLLNVQHDLKPEYLQDYLIEYCYKYNRRFLLKKLFNRLLIVCASYKKNKFSGTIPDTDIYKFQTG